MTVTVCGLRIVMTSLGRCADPDGIYQSGRPLRDMVTVQAVWLAGLGRAIAGRVGYGAAYTDQAADQAAR